MKYVAACFFSAIVGGLFVVWLTDPGAAEQTVAQNRDGRRGPGFPQPAPDQRDSFRFEDPIDRGPYELSPEESVNVAVYETVNKGVVNITTRTNRADRFLLWDMPSEGSGSGSVLDKAGHILTNFHVIENARAVAVNLFDGNTYEASFVGADPINDIAVIKIEAPGGSLVSPSQSAIRIAYRSACGCSRSATHLAWSGQ